MSALYFSGIQYSRRKCELRSLVYQIQYGFKKDKVARTTDAKATYDTRTLSL